MNVERGSPAGTAVLAVATAAVLALGGWWWVASAPPRPAAAPAPAPEPVPVQPTPILTAEPEVYPHPSEIVQVDLSVVEERLPRRGGVIREQSGVLTDSGAIDYSGTVASGARFVLEYACDGDGVLEVDVITPDGSEHHRTLECDLTLETVEFAAGSVGYALVRVVARTEWFVAVAVQLAQVSTIPGDNRTPD